MAGMLGFPETWAQMFEGKLFFGHDYQDRASVLLSRSVAAQSYDELKIPFKVTEMEYEGKQAFKIDHDENWSVVITPNTDKYLIGKNHLFIKREETSRKVQDEDCIVS